MHFIAIKGRYFNLNHIVQLSPVYQGVATSVGGYNPGICVSTVKASQTLCDESQIYETVEQAVDAAERTIQHTLEKTLNK